jgi:hypothetical protein
LTFYAIASKLWPIPFPQPENFMSAIPLINDKRETRGWMLYDWANSAFSTTVVTVFLGRTSPA